MERRSAPARSAPIASDSLVAALLTALILYPMATRGLDVHHDGLMLKGALDVATGQTLFRDTFTQYGPLTTWLQAAALSVFGKSLLTLRLLTVFAAAISAGLLVRLWGQYLSRAWTWAAIALWLCLAPEYSKYWTLLPWSSVLIMPFQIGAALAWIRSAREGSGALAWSALAGALAALVFWARTPVGLLLMVALLAGEAILGAWTGERRASLKRLAGIALGLAAVHLLFVAALSSSGTLGAWFQQCIVWPASWASDKGSGVGKILGTLFMLDAPLFDNSGGGAKAWLRAGGLAAFAGLLFFPLLSRRWKTGGKAWLAATLALFALAAALDWEAFRSSTSWATLSPLALLAGCALLLGRTPRGAGRIAALPALMTLAAALASWAQYYPVNCPRHVYWAMTPAVGLLLHFWLRASGEQSRRVWKLSANAWILALLLLPLGISRATQLSAKVRQLSHPTSSGPVRGLKLTEGEVVSLARASAAFEALLARRPDAPLLLEGDDPLFATWVHDLANYRPIYLSWPGLEPTGEEKAKREAFIRERRPLVLAQRSLDPELSELLASLGYKSAFKLGTEWGELHADLD